MRLEWIEDILAVLETGSLNRAAERRYLTQPAFSRRIRQIEDYIGVELVDRSRKPARVRDSVARAEDKLEGLAVGLRELLYELRQEERRVENHLVIASQHAITASVTPPLVDRLSSRRNMSFRLRSANRAECFTLLLTRQADLTLTYKSDDEVLPLHGSSLQEHIVGHEAFVPVVSAEALDAINDEYVHGQLPIVSYPPDVFLGALMERTILPKLRQRLFVRAKAETALTLAAVELALTGVGIAWVPRFLAARQIARGELIELSHVFGKAGLSIAAVGTFEQEPSIVDDLRAVIGQLAER